MSNTNLNLNQIEHELDFFNKKPKVHTNSDQRSVFTIFKQYFHPKYLKKIPLLSILIILSITLISIYPYHKQENTPVATITLYPKTEPYKNIQENISKNRVSSSEEFMKTIDTSKLTKDEKKNLDTLVTGFWNIGKQLGQIQKDSERFQPTK